MKRQPEGIPTGGQFATDRRAEPASTLSTGVPEELLYPSYAESSTSKVNGFAEAYGPDTEPEEVVRGILGDLHHFAAKYGVDMDVEMERGSNYFRDEVVQDAQRQHSLDMFAKLETQGANREQLFERWNEMQQEQEDESLQGPEYHAVDAALQRADVQVMATALRAQYPEADTFTIRENEDGENQYDILELTTGDQSIKNDVDDPLIAGELYKNGPYLDEAVLHINRFDHSWAEGIAENISNKHDGKMFRINLAAASDLPAPD